ncbi:hypothetical protein RFI_01932, partial [Reticulomyxa filosa]
MECLKIKKFSNINTWGIGLQHKNLLKDKRNKDLHTQSQCVLHKHEITICGSYQQRDCHFYHTLKNEYKQSVVKLIDNNYKDNNEISLLSFGSDWKGRNGHTLVMKYVSVCDDISDKSSFHRQLKSKKSIMKYEDVKKEFESNEPLFQIIWTSFQQIKQKYFHFLFDKK